MGRLGGMVRVPSSCALSLFGENWGCRCVPFYGEGGAGSASNTMWPGPSFFLIHETFWPQNTNTTDRQTGQTYRTTV